MLAALKRIRMAIFAKRMNALAGRRTFRPSVEVLVGRYLPAVNVWFGGTGLWETDGNWSLNRAPIQTDDVQIYTGTCSLNNLEAYAASVLVWGQSRFAIGSSGILNVTRDF